MNCTRCNTPIEPGARFCVHCGYDTLATQQYQSQSANPQPNSNAKTEKLSDMFSSSQFASFDQGKFFTFLNPLIKTFDNGSFFRRPMSLLYKLFAIVFLLVPLVLLISGIRNLEYLRASYTLALVLAFLILSFTSWLCFQIWWSRSKHINEIIRKDSEFVVTPLIAHMLQTTGESLGIFIGIGLFLSMLVALLVAGSEGVRAISMGDLADLTGGAAIGILVIPMYGFFIVLIFRFLAEQIKTWAAIANNTKKERK
jgi:hypothetical protein